MSIDGVPTIHLITLSQFTNDFTSATLTSVYSNVGRKWAWYTDDLTPLSYKWLGVGRSRENVLCYRRNVWGFSSMEHEDQSTWRLHWWSDGSKRVRHSTFQLARLPLRYRMLLSFWVWGLRVDLKLVIHAWLVSHLLWVLGFNCRRPFILPCQIRLRWVIKCFGVGYRHPWCHKWCYAPVRPGVHSSGGNPWVSYFLINQGSTLAYSYCFYYETLKRSAPSHGTMLFLHVCTLSYPCNGFY